MTETTLKVCTADTVTPKIISRAVLFFFAAFILCAALLHIILPPAIGLYAALRSEKLILLNQFKDRATTAVFGSSHVHNGFDPRTFDQALAGTALTTTSLNLGIEGGSQTEQRAMALQFVSHLKPHPDQACFVLLELNAGANFTDDHLVHPRAINIYDWPTVRFISRLSPPSLGRGRAAGRLLYALAASGLYYTNVGMLSNLIFNPQPDQEMLAEETNDDRRGLLTPHQEAGSASLVHLFATIDRSMKPAPEQLLPGNYDLLAELQHASPVRNVHFIYWVSPRADNLAHYPVYPAEITASGVTTPILSIARPDLYPALYQPQNWVDDSHLSAPGAALLGNLLGSQLLGWYKAHPQPMACGG